MTTKHLSRSQERRLAFQVIYATHFSTEPDPAFLARTFDNFRDPEIPMDSREESFAWALVTGVFTHSKELDPIIDKFSRHWKLTRIAKIELTILRLSLFEMLHCPEIPLKVAMNEAIELAKQFGDENSRNFVNGILDGVARGIGEGQFGSRRNI
ncbi:MAG TPA: transcription antitermination factor NusB [Desulfomicrobiaceae bacterium]|jgi:N utilization substance protein B|nr:transcription antitermination factor NusB [Desulfomicrobiaceae bacterium]